MIVAFPTSSLCPPFQLLKSTIHAHKLIRELKGVTTDMAAVQVMTMSAVGAADRTLFFGARMPTEMKKMLPHLKSLDKGLFRKLLQSQTSSTALHIAVPL